MSLRNRVLKGDAIEIPSGPSLLESLWSELLKEWTDPDVIVCDPEYKDAYAYDAGYCVGLAYAIAKIEMPYITADNRIEHVIELARERKENMEGG